jgi:uncharacterized protein YegL
MLRIILVLDESHSMISKIDSYIKGINSLLLTQKRENNHALFTLIKFGETVKHTCSFIPIKHLPEFTKEHYTPNGMTPLYDAIGMGMCLGHENDDDRTIMIILTDGEENYSNKFKLQDIRDKIHNLSESKKWEFIYVAANQNAQKTGKNLGISTCITYNATEKSISDVVKACNIAIGHATYRWTGVQNQHTHKIVPFDVRDITDGFMNFSI